MAVHLTPKQHAFVDHYAACGNATEAARKAGYKKPHVQGSQNLEKLSIQSALAELTAKVSDERIATAAERQQFWTGVMRGVDIYKVTPEIDMKDRLNYKVTPEIDMKDRLKAAELLGKAHQDFVDKTEITSNGFTLVMQLGGKE